MSTPTVCTPDYCVAGASACGAGYRAPARPTIPLRPVVAVEHLTPVVTVPLDAHTAQLVADWSDEQKRLLLGLQQRLTVKEMGTLGAYFARVLDQR